jgi:alpha-galactosidase
MNCPPLCSLLMSLLVVPMLLRQSAATKGLGGTPALGFNNCNIECCNATMPNAAFIKQTADLFVKLGLKDAGYLYINMDVSL